MEFIIFKNFISIEVLIVFYYIGAIIFPIMVWLYSKPLIKKYQLFSDSYFKGKDFLWKLLNKKQKVKIIGLLIPFFIFVQLLWRVLFEFLIAFMQIHEVLLKTNL